MNIKQLALKLEVDQESAFQYAEIMVLLSIAHRTDGPTKEEHLYSFEKDPASFQALLSSFQSQGAQA